MDGFRDRLNGRYERQGARTNERSDRYGRGDEDRYGRGDDDRYGRGDEERYGRGSRRDVKSEGLGIEEVSNAIDASNKDQLEVIADMFEDAKEDRLESEKAIIGSISDKLDNVIKSLDAADKSEPEGATPVDTEILSRIERMAAQNAQSLDESGEMLERNVNSLRTNTEMLGEIRNGIGEIRSAQMEMQSSAQMIKQELQESIQGISGAMYTQTPSVNYEQSSDDGKEEILSAVSDNRSLLNMIRQDILVGMNKQADVAEVSGEAKSSDDIEARFKEMEDHVHKECVRCYRNVQSAMQEQLENINNGVSAEVKKGVGVPTILGIVSIVLNIVTVGLLVLNTLGITLF